MMKKEEIFNCPICFGFMMRLDHKEIYPDDFVYCEECGYYVPVSTYQEDWRQLKEYAEKQILKNK